MTPEDNKPQAYCGPLNERLKEAFNPWWDIKEGSCILCPSNLDIYLVSMNRALTLVCKDVGSKSYGKFAIQF